MILGALAQRLAARVTARALARAPLAVDHGGWLQPGPGGPRVWIRPSDPSWYEPGWSLVTPHRGPLGIIVHYTSTPYGTAAAMADTHQRPMEEVRAERIRDNPRWAPASWHLTIANNGDVWQQIPLDRRAWHCRETPAAARRLADSPAWPDVPPVPNHTLIGIELEGHGCYTEAQIATACMVWPAIVGHYGIVEDLALLHHSELDPHRRDDPGPEWKRVHEPRVRRATFG